MLETTRLWLRFFLAVLFWISSRTAWSMDDLGVYDNTNHHHHRRRRTIVGGEPADPTRFPYFVRLDYNGRVGCGATLMHREFILTAAHCVPDDNILYIIRAFFVTNDDDDESTKSPRRIRKRFIHPRYDDDEDMYDVALLQIDPPAPDHIPLIQLAQSHFEKSTSLSYSSSSSSSSSPRMVDLQSGDNVTVLGFGVVTESDNRVSDVLRQVELKIVDDAACDALYGGGWIHNPSMICAADPEQGPCYRDSGGPLLILGSSETQEPSSTTSSSSSSPSSLNVVGNATANNNETTQTTTRTTPAMAGTTTIMAQDIQVGLVSFGGDRCGDVNQPSVYTDVAHLSEWIDQVLCPYMTSDCTSDSSSNGSGENPGGQPCTRDCSRYPPSSSSSPSPSYSYLSWLMTLAFWFGVIQ